MSTPTGKVIIAVYSFEGNCRALAGVMAEATGGEVADITPIREISRNVVWKYLAGGRSAFMRETVPLQPTAFEVTERDLLILGSPVWAWNIPPATRSFLAGRDWTGMRTALFVMHRGGQGKALRTMREMVGEGGGVVLGASDFHDLRTRDPVKTKTLAVDWARDMRKAAGL